jgi:hypothetical protein
MHAGGSDHYASLQFPRPDVHEEMQITDVCKAGDIGSAPLPNGVTQKIG